MFLDIAPSEFLVIAVVAVVFIGPKDMPRALRTAGRWMGKMRRVSNQLRSGLETMIREAELEEMEAKWREQNEAIMRSHANPASPPLTGQPAQGPPAGISPAQALPAESMPAENMRAENMRASSAGAPAHDAVPPSIEPPAALLPAVGPEELVSSAPVSSAPVSGGSVSGAPKPGASVSVQPASPAARPAQS